MMPGRKYLRPEEVERVLVLTTDETDKLLLQVGVTLGCRVSEILSIRIHDIEWQYVNIWDEKKDEPRLCVVDQETALNIDHYIQHHYKAERGVRKAYQRLFQFSSKTANRKVKAAFKRAEIPSSVPYRWHTLRHTYIRFMLDRYKDRALQFICLQTGDSPATILKYYAEPAIEERLRVANEVSITRLTIDQWKKDQEDNHDIRG